MLKWIKNYFAMRRYVKLTTKLIRGRARETLTETEEDTLLDEMDDVWWAMTENGRKKMNKMDRNKIKR